MRSQSDVLLQSRVEGLRPRVRRKKPRTTAPGDTDTERPSCAALPSRAPSALAHCQPLEATGYQLSFVLQREAHHPSVLKSAQPSDREVHRNAPITAFSLDR